MFLQAIFPFHLFYSVRLISLPRKGIYLFLYITLFWKLRDKSNLKEISVCEIILVCTYVSCQLTQEMGILDFNIHFLCCFLLIDNNLALCS